MMQIENLERVYHLGKANVAALKGVSFNIEDGEFVAIMGPSGSGKSTLMHILGCLDRPTQGRYYLEGHDISKLSDNQLAEIRNKNIGFVFQQFNLLPRMNSLHNVEIPLIYRHTRRSTRLEKAKKALERVGLGERLHHKPSEVSGGEKQRVAIARALINDPSLILADEPTGNLDTRTGNEIMKIFHNLNQQGHTIIVVTHENEIARQARRVIRLRDGLMVGDEVIGSAV